MPDFHFILSRTPPDVFMNGSVENDFRGTGSMPIEITELNERFSIATADLISRIRQKEGRRIAKLESSAISVRRDIQMRDGTGKFWIALADRTVVGTIELRILDLNSAVLQKMYVEPARRRRGIARLLLETLVSWATLNSITRVYLGTYAKNVAARRFYKNHGFHRLQSIQIPDWFPRSPIDECVYLRCLDGQLDSQQGEKI